MRVRWSHVSHGHRPQHRSDSGPSIRGTYPPVVYYLRPAIPISEYKTDCPRHTRSNKQQQTNIPYMISALGAGGWLTWLFSKLLSKVNTSNNKQHKQINRLDASTPPHPGNAPPLLRVAGCTGAQVRSQDGRILMFPAQTANRHVKGRGRRASIRKGKCTSSCAYADHPPQQTSASMDKSKYRHKWSRLGTDKVRLTGVQMPQTLGWPAAWQHKSPLTEGLVG